MKAARKAIPLAIAAAFAFSCQCQRMQSKFSRCHSAGQVVCLASDSRHAFRKEVSGSSCLDISKFANNAAATWENGGKPPDFCEIVFALFWNAPFIRAKASASLLKSVQSEKPKWSDVLLGVNEPFKNREARTRAAQIAVLAEKYLLPLTIVELDNARWLLEGDK